MAINVESNVSEVKTRNITSKTAELIAVINILADNKHHEYAKIWSKKILNRLSSKSLRMLTLIAGLPFEGIEFFEIILDTKIFNNVNDLCSKILEYDDLDFICKLSGEGISHKKIALIKNDREQFDKFINELQWLYRGIKEIYEIIFFDTVSFKKSLVELIKEVDNKIFEEKFDSLDKAYEDAVDDMNQKLNKMHPLQVASEIMNKSIMRKDGISEYIFIPSYFISPHYVMAYNKNSRLLLYDIRKEAAIYRSETGKELSSSLKILSDKTRLEIVRLLILQPCSGKTLSARLKLSTATISHHIELLRSIELIKETRDKNTKYYSVNTKNIDKLLKKFEDYLYNN